VTETSAAERPPQATPEVVEETPSAVPGTPVGVWIVYVLGLLGAVVFAASLLFVALAYATSGGGGTGINVSMPALVLWLAVTVAAAGTFLWRRYGRPK